MQVSAVGPVEISVIIYIQVMFIAQDFNKTVPSYP